MASSLLALLDDIATILDDVSVLTKVAAKKTAGVLGDDLALNAQQVTGVSTDRELPVVWAVARGSMINKAILVPAALAIGAFIPRAVVNPAVDLVQVEKDKIKGAVRTDFILSAEIIAITLGTVAASPFVTQVSVLVGISLLMTVGVYGLVAGIVKLDDLGLYLSRQANAAKQSVGRAILVSAPWLMKALSVAGTAAMFLVGGGILTHVHEPLPRLPRSVAGRTAGPASVRAGGRRPVASGAGQPAGGTLA